VLNYDRSRVRPVSSSGVVRNNREEHLQQATSHVAQLSEAVTKSTRFAMLQNQASQVDKIIQDVSAQGYLGWTSASC